MAIRARSRKLRGEQPFLCDCEATSNLVLQRHLAELSFPRPEIRGKLIQIDSVGEKKCEISGNFSDPIIFRRIAGSRRATPQNQPHRKLVDPADHTPEV